MIVVHMHLSDEVTCIPSLVANTYPSSFFTSFLSTANYRK